jgi:hypothetical protein
MEGREKVQMVEQEQSGSPNTNSPPNLVYTTISERPIKEDSKEELEEEQSYLSQPILKKLRKAKRTPQKEQIVKKEQPLSNKPQVPQVPHASNTPQAPPTTMPWMMWSKLTF